MKEPDEYEALPKDIPSEEGVIGAVLIDDTYFLKLNSIINADDFFLHKHRFIWEAFARLQENGDPIDFLTINGELDRYNQLSEVGGPAYLTSLMNQCPTTTNSETYARAVKKYAAKRRLLSVANGIATMCYDEKQNPEDIKSSIENELSKIETTSKIDNRIYSAREIASNSLDSTINASLGDRVFKFDIIDLDNVLYISRGDLVIIGGRPGTGKTILLATAIMNNPEKRGLIFELETGHEQLGQRILSQTSKVPAHRIVRGKLDAEEWAAFQKSAEEFGERDLFICDMPSIKIGQMKAVARKLHLEKPLDYIMVDYLQLATGDGKSDTRAIEVGSVAMGLKHIAKDLNIPVLAAAQINRGSEMVSEKRPKLHNLKESGDIEQSADSVIFVHPKENGRLLLLEKQRMGSLAEIPVQFNQQLMRFDNAFPIKD